MTPRRTLLVVVVLASLFSSGCGLLIATARSAVSRSGGALGEASQVRGSTWGASARHALGCGNAATSPQNVYAFTAASGGTYVFTSTTSDYDGVLAVYDVSGTELACNDDWQSTRSSQVTVVLARGQVVELVQGGYSGASGHYELTTPAPVSGSALASADTTDASGVSPTPSPPPSPLTLGSTVSGDTRGLPSIERIECPPLGSMQEWTFTPTEDGVYVFQVDAQYDTFLGLIDEYGAALACNDEWGDGTRARASATMLAGHPYRVVVGGGSQQAGAYSLTAIRAALGGALSVSTPLLFAPADTDSAPSGCGAPAGSVDRTFTFTPRREAFYAIATDVTGWLVVADARTEVACFRLSPSERVGVHLKARQRYQFVVELGYEDGTAHFVQIDPVAFDAPDWQVPPAPPPIAAFGSRPP